MNIPLSTLGILLLSAAGSAAQAPETPHSTIQTSGAAAAQLPPDYATLALEVTAVAQTPGEAGRASAGLANELLSALISLGIPPDSIITTNYRLERRSVRSGPGYQYVATNTVMPRIWDLSRIGPAIDTATAVGTTRMSRLDFHLADASEAADSVLAAATRAAHRRAQVMATAAGGQLGPLVELTTERAYGSTSGLGLDQIVVTGAAQAAPRETPVTPGTVELRVTVYGRWEFSSP